jgi:hypothetical protein
MKIKGRKLFPWYVILRRLSMSPLIFGGMIITWVGIFIGIGYKTAREWWRAAR